VTGPGDGVRVRRIRADEADALRAVRLRALADTPLAFGSTHAREAAYPRERWLAWARDSAAGAAHATFLAVDGADAPVGLAFAIVDPGAGPAHLYSMWVAPEARGRGAGAALVGTVIEWTRTSGARTLRTAVTIGNDAAARLYERAGFRDTGAREPLGHSEAEVAVLERDLAA
jgi:GNAT superfamily N-acetyltransferase